MTQAQPLLGGRANSIHYGSSGTYLPVKEKLNHGISYL